MADGAARLLQTAAAPDLLQRHIAHGGDALHVGTRGDHAHGVDGGRGIAGQTAEPRGLAIEVGDAREKEGRGGQEPASGNGGAQTVQLDRERFEVLVLKQERTPLQETLAFVQEIRVNGREFELAYAEGFREWHHLSHAAEVLRRNHMIDADVDVWREFAQQADAVQGALEIAAAPDAVMQLRLRRFQ